MVGFDKKSAVHTGYRGMLLLLLLLTSWSRTASGGEGGEYRLVPALDIPVLGVSAATWAGFAIAEPFVDYDHCNDTCDPASVNSLDRGVIDNANPSLRTAADFTLGTMMGVSLFATLLKMQHSPSKDVFVEMFILVEAAAITGALAMIVKHSVQRPRPYMYNPDTGDEYRRGDSGDYLSFFSGHASTAFTLAAAFSRIYSQTRPNSRLKWFVYTFTFGLAAATAGFRVASGDHFWTDVVVGAAVGTGVGFLVPALHEVRSDKVDTDLVVGPGHLTLVGWF